MTYKGIIPNSWVTDSEAARMLDIPVSTLYDWKASGVFDNIRCQEVEGYDYYSIGDIENLITSLTEEGYYDYLFQIWMTAEQAAEVLGVNASVFQHRVLSGELSQVRSFKHGRLNLYSIEDVMALYDRPNNTEYLSNGNSGWLTIEQVEEILGISRGTFLRFLNSGEIPDVRQTNEGRRKFYNAEDVQAVLEKLSQDYLPPTDGSWLPVKEVAKTFGVSHYHLLNLIRNGTLPEIRTRKFGRQRYFNAEDVEEAVDILSSEGCCGIIENRWLKPEEVAKRLGIPLPTLYFWLNRRQIIPETLYRRSGNHTYFKSSDIDALKTYLRDNGYWDDLGENWEPTAKVARKAGVSGSTLLRWIEDGTIPSNKYRRVSRSFYFDVNYLDVLAERGIIPPMDGKWLKTAEVADRLGVTESTIFTWMNKGYIPSDKYKKIGHAFYFDKDYIAGITPEDFTPSLGDGWIRAFKADAKLGLRKGTLLKWLKEGKIPSDKYRKVLNKCYFDAAYIDELYDRDFRATIEDGMLNVKEAAQRLGLSTTTVYTWIKDGYVPHDKYTRKSNGFYLDPSYVDTLLAKLTDFGYFKSPNDPWVYKSKMAKLFGIDIHILSEWIKSDDTPRSVRRKHEGKVQYRMSYLTKLYLSKSGDGDGNGDYLNEWMTLDQVKEAAGVTRTVIYQWIIAEQVPEIRTKIFNGLTLYNTSDVVAWLASEK